MRGLARHVVWGLALVAGAPAWADAEIVHWSTGRTLSVRGHRIDGDSITLIFHAGGEVTCPARLVVRVDPDEAMPGEAVTAGRPANTSAPAVPTALPARADPYAALIARAARRHDVDPRLVHAVIRAESNFQARARSRRGARGLMQLMPATLREYAVRNPYDPAANIDAGTRHLRGLLDLFPLKDALAAYNAGQGAVIRHGGVPPFAETEAYVSRILREVSVPPVTGSAASNP
jgi:soluble lytic murein transglycosylase-like protein